MTRSPGALSGAVLILGSGKVGSALYKGLKRANAAAQVRSLRKRALPKRISAELLVLCARDPELPELAERLRGRVSAHTAVIHVAGALGPDAIGALRGQCAGVGQAHPLISFASARRAPELEGAHLLVAGDPVAVRRARALGRALGMVPRRWSQPDLAAYHAAAGLVANGAAALAGAGARLIEAAGCPPGDVGRVLGPLLRSVAENIEQLGLPAALTGPIRRGDAQTIERHLAAITRQAPELRALYLAVARAQLPMARALGDAPESALARLERALGRSRP